MMKKVRKVKVKEDTNLTGKKRNHENERRLKGKKKVTGTKKTLGMRYLWLKNTTGGYEKGVSPIQLPDAPEGHPTAA